MTWTRAVLTGVLLALSISLAWGRIDSWQSHGREANPSALPAGEPTSPGPDAPSGPAALSLARHPDRIADEAGILALYRPGLAWLTQSWYDDLGIDFHVATLNDSDLSIEQLAAEVLSLRRVGANAPTGGILLMLNPGRREARIEISYELEGALPDALVGRIVEDQLAPYLSYGASGMATMDIVKVLKDIVLTEAVRGRLPLPDEFRARASYREWEAFLSGGAGSQVQVPDAEELAGRDLKAVIGDPAQRGRYAPGADPLESVEALIRSQRELVGDPTLPLFTPGSQCMKRRYPFAPYEELERARLTDAGRPWRVLTHGDRAVVGSARPPRGFVPVLLHRIDGLWRVDVVETWKNLFFDGKGGYVLGNSNTPYAFGLASFGAGRAFDVRAWDLGGIDIETVLAALSKQDGALFEFLQGEVLYRNCFLPEHAVAHYRKAVELAPTAPLFTETLGDRARHVGFFDLAVDTYRKLSPPPLLKLAAAYAGRGDFSDAIEATERAVERDPFDAEALQLMSRYLELAGRGGEAREIQHELDSLAKDPARRLETIEIEIDPPRPAYERGDPILVGATKVYDHASFSVTIRNPSARAVTFDRLVANTVGTGAPGSLGDVRPFWPWQAPYRLEPGGAITVDRTWGFTTPTNHQQLSYVLEMCWRGDADPRQCRTERIDLLPR